MSTERFTIDRPDPQGPTTYRYRFFLGADDVKNKVFLHVYNYTSCTTLPARTKKILIEDKALALSHKMNLMRHHTGRYLETEQRWLGALRNEFSKPLGTMVLLLDEPELTGEYEALLFQMKAMLDILASTLVTVYGDDRNPIKKHLTFGNKGQDVIAAIERFQRANPCREPKVRELLAHLRTECIKATHYDDGSVNWLLTMINVRDTVAHYRRYETIAYQMEEVDGTNVIIPPMATPEQTMPELLEVAYHNMLIFLQDFIALLLLPHFDAYFAPASFPEEAIDQAIAPKWFIMPTKMKEFGLGGVTTNPAVLMQYLSIDPPPIDAMRCQQMLMYYAGFLDGTETP